MQRSEDFFEAFFFGFKTHNPIHNTIFFNSLDLLQSFISYFKQEAAPIIERALTENFNVKGIKGKAFLEKSSTPLSSRDPQAQRFLNMIMPLSNRERQCLELFKEGKTAKMTGDMLGLSKRTVEFYFENIKNKLGCSSKSDLLLW